MRLRAFAVAPRSFVEHQALKCLGIVVTGDCVAT